MTYGWLETKPDLGRVAMAGNEIAGYVGMVYADRAIGGASERVVGICAWYLGSPWRGRGLGRELMRRATEDPRLHYAILTSSSRTPPILAQVGYRVLEDERVTWRRGGAASRSEVEQDPAAIAARVDAAARRLLEDHAGLPVVPLLLEAEGRTALLMLSVKRKAGDRLWFDVLHVGDGALLARNAQALANTILPEGEDAVLAVDRRLLAGECPVGGLVESLKVPRFFKSARLEPRHIDNLYSELQLLDLKLD
jgi:hypothetical protein